MCFCEFFYQIIDFKGSLYAKTDKISKNGRKYQKIVKQKSLTGIVVYAKI